MGSTLVLAGAQAGRRDSEVYFIVVKFDVLPEWSDRWMDLVADFTEATGPSREPVVQWSRSPEEANTSYLIEAFTDEGAVRTSTASTSRRRPRDAPGTRLTPRIVSRQIEGSGWDVMGEMTID